MRPIGDASLPSIQTLQKVELFAGLQKEQLEAILQRSQRHQLPAGDRFFSQGERATKFHLLIEGQVRITQVTLDGQQVLVRLAGPSQIFGGIAAIRSGEYPASAESLVPCVALVWSGESMQDLLERFPRMALNMMFLLSDQIEVLQDRLREMTTERVERRIAHTLLRLIRHAGRKVEEGILLDLPLTRLDLAEMSGTTLYTVSRILSRWETDGIVESGRQRVVVRVPHRLVAIAEDLSPKPEKHNPAT
jgi:CRP-like cAMP-binding protein